MIFILILYPAEVVLSARRIFMESLESLKYRTKSSASRDTLPFIFVLSFLLYCLIALRL